MVKLSHIDAANRPSMVDVGDKSVTRREAHAQSIVILPADVLAALDGDDIQSKKGPVFATAIIAGVMAAKKTHELIPFCHPLGLENCKITIDVSDDRATIDCICRVTHKTGVEMEALTGASVAALTIYDMCKALSHDIIIAETRLLAKTGGKRDFQHVD
ncbi:MAG: cyclic pyranopterin monophosphate synthase MoaC [Gammaproteobacteria bacterium]|nr:cyclic pyranopterin monophosphate synthase MoaC [Gammaproteobacteria bacterium]